MDKKPLLFKVNMLGVGAVGKTAIITRYTEGFFADEYKSTKITIGASFSTKRFRIEGREITFQIWDIAGQERFRSLRQPYFTGSHGALAIFDLTRRATLDALQEWIIDIRKAVENIPIILVGNKFDLEELREVSKEEAIDFMRRNHCSGYIETSAKTGENVEESYEVLARFMSGISSPPIPYIKIGMKNKKIEQKHIEIEPENLEIYKR